MAEYKEKKCLFNIKSSYIINEIFSFLNEEKQKLNMIIYNKQLQKIIEVDIKDYQKISGKYKVGEKNGLGKEYIKGSSYLTYLFSFISSKII